MPLRADAKGVFELGHDDMDSSSCGITSHQWLRQVGYHKTKLDQTEQNLHIHHVNIWRLTRSSYKTKCSEHSFTFCTHDICANI